MADSKWISGLRDDMPILAAARHVLLVRLAAVRERLPDAVVRSAEDMEHVHQLRVSTRRSGAALRIFASCLAEKQYKKVRRRLRRIRRAAGAARDWDVFVEDISGRLAKASSRHKAGLEVLLGIGHGQRMAAQSALDALGEQAAASLDGLVAETISALRVPEQVAAEGTLRDLALPMLATLLRELEEAAHGDLQDYEHLHQVRILGKRLRYAMEVFECCFEPSFRDEHYAAVEEMQDMLGEANDSYVASLRLDGITRRLQATQPELWPRYRTGMDALAKYHRKRLVERREAFLQWWGHWQQSGAEETFASQFTG